VELEDVGDVVELELGAPPVPPEPSLPVVEVCDADAASPVAPGPGSMAVLEQPIAAAAATRKKVRMKPPK
jgi:hypothetical protein